jgi:hypothetical protein
MSSLPITGSKYENGYTHERNPVSDLREYLPYCAATTSTHYIGETVTGEEHEKAAAWAKALGYKVLSREDLPEIAGIERRSNSLFDPTTTLKVIVFVNEKREELLITFGATASFEAECDDKQLSKTYLWTQLNQMRENIFGYLAPIYIKAEKVTTDLLTHDNFLPYKKMISAQSFGGSIAQYVSLRLSVPAVIFNSMPIGSELQRSIGSKKLQNANELIKHLSINNDFLSDGTCFGRAIDWGLNWIGVRTPGAFGRREVMPSRYPESYFKTHSYVMGSIALAVGFEDPPTGADLERQLKEEAEIEAAKAASLVDKDESDEKSFPPPQQNMDRESTSEATSVHFVHPVDRDESDVKESPFGQQDVNEEDAMNIALRESLLD